MLESERWVHVPATSILTENGERLLVHPPSRRGTSRVWRSWPTRGRAVGLILETIEEVRESGGGRLVWHTGDGASPPFMDDLLSRHGFEKTEDLEVLAFELGDDPRPRLPRLDGRDLRVDLVRDAAGLREAHAIESRVFPHSPELTDPEIRDYLRGVEAPWSRKPEPDYADARTLRFLAFVSDPVDRGDRRGAGRWRNGTAVGGRNARGAPRTGRLPRPGRREVPSRPRPLRHACPDKGKHGHLSTPPPKRRVQTRCLRTPPRATDPRRRPPHNQPHGSPAKGYLQPL
jgi:hypothetical protein